MKPMQTPSRILSLQNRSHRGRRAAWGPVIALMLASLAGCYHAGGLQRPPLISEEIPSVLGDRIGGYKATAVPGDYFLGSDSMALVVNGTPFKQQSSATGTISGGSIIDIGDVELDQNYLRVSTPSDRLESLGPVINQDPDLPLVFDTFQVSNGPNFSSITMHGGLHDPQHKVVGAAGWDTSDRISGVDVLHTISLSNLRTYVTVTTTLTNNTAATLGIYNIGDYLHQQGGGFRFNIPAAKDFLGNKLDNWGIDIPATGSGTSSTFGHPDQAVVANMVALMGNEPSGDMDFHCTLGVLPEDSDQLLVTSDPQPAFTDPRPKATPRLVIGGLPSYDTQNKVLAGLKPKQSVSFTRRVYVTAGASSKYSIGYYDQTYGQPNQATGIFNIMAMDRYTLHSMEFGSAIFYVEGTAQLSGPLQTEVRIERYTKDALPVIGNTKDIDYAAFLSDNTSWTLERTEWLEPEDNYSSSSHAPGHIGALLPAGDSGKSAYYRIAFRNRLSPTDPVAPTWIYLDQTTNTAVSDPMPLTVQSEKIFGISQDSHICPEYDQIATGGIVIGGHSIGGTIVHAKYAVVSITARPDNLSGSSGVSIWQPLRVTVCNDEKDASGNYLPDPNMARARTIGGTFNVSTGMKDFTGSNLGVNGFVGGNEAFASYLTTGLWLPSGKFTFYGTRGPLSALSTQSAEVKADLVNPAHEFIIFQDPLPPGWTSFDVPGPSQITTGGFLPIEKLASAVAEDVQVVASTEMDRLTSASTTYDDFRSEFDYYGSSDAQRFAILKDPFVVGARSSLLNGFGLVTTLFTPEPRNERNGGAKDPTSWTLADFLTQAEGQFTIVNRPRGPQGLFTQKGISATTLADSHSWWNTTGPFSKGLTNGQFDAIELLRGESWDPANPDAWFSEFKTLRNDWFTLISHQTPTKFTKAMGLSSALFSLDTPVGLARTYIKAQGYSFVHLDGFTQSTLSVMQDALNSGAAVASTGPFLDVTATGTSGKAVPIGGLVEGSNSSVTLTVNLWISDWLPVDELRVIVNGTVTSLDMNQLTNIEDDWRHFQGTYTLPMPSGKDAWIVVEAGVPLSTTGAYMPGTPWARIMRGIYPIAITNPIFVDVNGGGYTPPGN